MIHTGDMGRVDEDGYFFIVDRQKDIIVCGGYNMYPGEVEEILYQHPAVREAAVVGMPDERYGEEVGAAVALREGAHATPRGPPRVRQRAGRGVQVPRHIWLVDEPPKGPTGKILKRQVRRPPEQRRLATADAAHNR